MKTLVLATAATWRSAQVFAMADAHGKTHPHGDRRAYLPITS